MAAASPEVVLMTASVRLGGREVAIVERVLIGGGTQTVTVDGQPEDRVHPTFERFHVRLLSQAGRMVPDELVEKLTWDDACEAGLAFARKVAVNAKQIAALSKALKSEH